MNHIIEDFTALSQKLNELEMERAKKLADSLNPPVDTSPSEIYYYTGTGFSSGDYDPA